MKSELEILERVMYVRYLLVLLLISGVLLPQFVLATSVSNYVETSANSGGNSVNGANGTNGQSGQDGQKGQDGTDGSNGKNGQQGSVIVGESSSEVYVRTTVDNKTHEVHRVATDTVSVEQTVTNGTSGNTHIYGSATAGTQPGKSQYNENDLDFLGESAGISGTSSPNEKRDETATSSERGGDLEVYEPSTSVFEKIGAFINSVINYVGIFF